MKWCLLAVAVERFSTLGPVGFSNPPWMFICDTLLAVPYRREIGKLLSTPNPGTYGFPLNIGGGHLIVGEPNRDGDCNGSSSIGLTRVRP